MSQIASLTRIAPHWVAGTLGHIHWTNDSQGAFTGPATGSLGTNYFVSHGFLIGYARQWDYFHGQVLNSSDQVPSRANFTVGTPTGFAYASYTTTASTATISFTVGGVNTVTGLYVNDAAALTFADDVAGTGVWIGNGAYRLNSIGTVAAPNFSWPNTIETGLPWYHGSHARCALVYQNNTNTIRQWQIQLARVGGTSNNASAGLLTSLGAATNLVARTEFTAALADAGNYQVTTGGNYPNSHRLDCRIYTPNSAYDENDLALLPLTLVCARSDSGGNFTNSGSDGSRRGFSCFSRPGASVADWLNYATQSNWQNIFEQIVMPGTRQRITLVFMFGHNVGAGEKSGDEFTTTWRDNYITLVNREVAAARAAYPNAEIIPLVIIPWRASEAGNVNNEASARSIHARGIEVASAVGADWFSFPAAFNFQEQTYFLHPSTYGFGMSLYNMLNQEMVRTARPVVPPRGRR